MARPRFFIPPVVSTSSAYAVTPACWGPKWLGAAASNVMVNWPIPPAVPLLAPPPSPAGAAPLDMPPSPIAIPLPPAPLDMPPSPIAIPLPLPPMPPMPPVPALPLAAPVPPPAAPVEAAPVPAAAPPSAAPPAAPPLPPPALPHGAPRAVPLPAAVLRPPGLSELHAAAAARQTSEARCHERCIWIRTILTQFLSGQQTALDCKKTPVPQLSAPSRFNLPTHLECSSSQRLAVGSD